MANKFAFALLGLLCLVPAYHAAPAPASQESSEEMIVKGFVERLKLTVLGIEEFSHLYEDILEKGEKVFIDVLKDPKVLEVKTKAMENQTKILQYFLDMLEKAKKENKKEHIFELVEEFNEVVNTFDRRVHDLSPEAVIIEKSLEENGLENIEKSIMAHFEKFMEKFNGEVEPYINGLKENEKKDEKKLIEWFEKMKLEKDTEKKIELFDDFFEKEDD